MQLGQLVERELRFALRERKAHDHILATDLAPEPVRRPLLRLRSTWTFEPNEVPLRHDVQSSAWMAKRLEKESRRGGSGRPSKAFEHMEASKHLGKIVVKM
jgi:hypothetical protein